MYLSGNVEYSNYYSFIAFYEFFVCGGEANTYLQPGRFFQLEWHQGPVDQHYLQLKLENQTCWQRQCQHKGVGVYPN